MRYPEDFFRTINAGVAQGRIGNMRDVLKALHSHYFVHHLKSNLHFYGVPSLESVREYLSVELAVNIIVGLQAAHCVVYDEQRYTVAPTAVGRAAAAEGLEIDSLVALNAIIDEAEHVSANFNTLLEALSEVQEIQILESDSYRVVPVRQLEALLMKRALRLVPPSCLGGRDCIRMEVTSPAARVVVGVLLHCSMVLINVDSASRSVGGLQKAADNGVDGPVIDDLFDDERHIEWLQRTSSLAASSVARFASAAARVVGLRHWRTARMLIRLTQMIRTRTWELDDDVMQLPLLRTSPNLRNLLRSAGVIHGNRNDLLALRQMEGNENSIDSVSRAAASLAVQGSTAAQRQHEGLSKICAAISQQAQEIPFLLSLKATGELVDTFDNGNFEFNIRVLVEYAASPEIDQTPWWVAAFNAKAGHEQLYCLERVRLKPSLETPRAGAVGETRLSFPLSAVSDDGNVLPRVAVMSCVYRIDGECDVDMQAT
jgi:hypothetical protein